MMFLTVTFNILTLTIAIRVPTAWPEQETRIIRDQSLRQTPYYSNPPATNLERWPSTINPDSKIRIQEFYAPNLAQHQIPADVFPIVTLPPENKKARLPDSGSSVENEELKVQIPDVRYSLPQVQPLIIQHRQNNDNNKYLIQTRHNNPENSPISQSLSYFSYNIDFPIVLDDWVPIVGQQQAPNKPQETDNVYTRNNPDRQRTPAVNKVSANRRRLPSTNTRRQYKNANDRIDVDSDSVYRQRNLERQRVLAKNYRDDKTHEPTFDTETPTESDVPTQPIYPGEGLWAIPGLKHEPFVKTDIQTKAEEQEEDDEEGKPDNYETFEKAKPEFEKQRSRYAEKLQSLPFTDAKVQEKEEEKESDEEEEVEEEDDFVPTQMLAQVRKTEEEEHLPSSVADPRLREAIKDSKIHTVYIEEGYEDVGYDHAGHEKNAEDKEGHSEYNKGASKVKQKVPKGKNLGFDAVDVVKEFENYEQPKEETEDEKQSDADVSESSYEDLDDKSKKNVSTNKYSARKENKTTEIKGLNDGSMELEITSEVKILTQPNNKKTAHKFVKIVPKFKNRDKNSKFRRKRFVNDLPQINVEKDFLDVLNSESPRPVQRATTEKYPYYKIKDTESLNKNSPLRYAEDLNNVPEKIPGEMSFYEHTKASECPEIPRNVNPIPDRVEKAIEKGKKGSEGNKEGQDGDVAELPDVPRLRNLGDKIDCLKARYFGENPLDSPIFREEYVGAPENIFKELDSLNNLGKVDYGPNLSNNEHGEQITSVPGNDENYSEEREDDYDNDVIIEEASPQETNLPDNVIQTTYKPTLSTTSANILPSTVSPTQPIASEVFVPNNIYDQIDYIDDYELTTTPNLSLNEISSTKSLSPLVSNTNETTNEREVSVGKNNYATSSDGIEGNLTLINNTVNETLDKIEAQMLVQQYNDYRQPRVFTVVSPPNLQNQTVNSTLDSDIQTEANEDPLPENAALRIRKRRRKRPYRPLMHVFDVNRFLPTPLSPLVPYPTTTTAAPKQKVLSEVYYKDEIRPSEQLNVFADVINNIKNSPKETLVAEGSQNVNAFQEITQEPIFQKTSGRKVKVPARKVRIKHVDPINYYNDKDSVYYITPTTTTTTTTTIRPRYRRKNKYKNHKPNDQVYEEYLDTIKGYQSEEDVKKVRPKVKPPQYEEEPFASQDSSFSSPSVHEDVLSGTVVDEVIGLEPPFSLGYSPNFDAEQEPISDQAPLNTFFVAGMKPPTKHKPLSYSDFRLLQHNRVRRRNNPHRIRKRSPIKPGYSEIKRDRQTPVTEETQQVEEEDDYVPNRNRNFRYDVENRRVVYINQKKEEEPTTSATPEEEEEDEGEYLTVVKPEPPKRTVIVTTEATGPSFLEFVHKLKSNSDYQVILDPKPTEKPKEEPTTKADSKEVESSTSKQIETVVPEFLSVISKLRSNEGYKEIKEKKEKPTTTAAPPIEEEETEPEDEDVRNSPGGILGANSYEKMQIFDITEYLPKPRDYTPKTVIDYSKYKTIQRAPVASRHNFSSRYNSEEDDLPLSNRDSSKASQNNAEDRGISSLEERTESPIYVEEETRRRSYSSSEEVEEPLIRKTTTTTTTEPPPETTTAKRVRPRRKRPTTTTERYTTTGATSTTKRTRRRSRPTTTTAEPVLEENFSQTQRVIQRRRFLHATDKEPQDSRNVPSNHKAFYTPILPEEIVEADSKKPLIHRKRKISRVVLPNQLSNDTKSDAGEIRPRKLDVEVFSRYDPSKKHGGNYRREEEGNDPQTVESNSVPPTAYEIEDSKEIRRLSDVVPKPFAFYSDPTLPRSVNQLRDSVAAEQLPSETGEEYQHTAQDESVREDNDYEDEIKINFNDNKKSQSVVTKPQVYIVKDPSKRLYFYAPVK